ncbi:hypothetical protein IMZ29_03100 [Achromobacter sp. GG226]|uniref:hypothetical protein n=1 Tax=Verticiella alkaliphila TaxID=2779529 RepID=UPI001C0CFEB1|nr:hypothetical protein [Verticiella sp. GG226]MBU4609570.1 hypothetical protein [Verticiella sp. GG226]
MKTGKSIPGVDRLPWWQQKWVVEFGAATLALLLLMRQRRSPPSDDPLSGQMTLGVIYFDSSSRGVFDNEEVQEQILSLVDAIADYVTWRY